MCLGTLPTQTAFAHPGGSDRRPASRVTNLPGLPKAEGFLGRWAWFYICDERVLGTVHSLKQSILGWGGLVTFPAGSSEKTFGISSNHRIWLLSKLSTVTRLFCVWPFLGLFSDRILISDSLTHPGSVYGALSVCWALGRGGSGAQTCPLGASRQTGMWRVRCESYEKSREAGERLFIPLKVDLGKPHGTQQSDHVAHGASLHKR